jgi:hypothetical protein
VLTVIDEEEVSYLMREPCTEVQVDEAINYTVYTNARKIECLTCDGCEKYLGKGWCGKELCWTQVVGEDDKINSSNYLPMPPLQRRKGNHWVDSEKSDEEDNASDER